MHFPKIFRLPRSKYICGRKRSDKIEDGFKRNITLSVIFILFGQLFITTSAGVSSSSTKRGQRLSQSHFEFSLLLYRAILESSSSNTSRIQTNSFIDNTDNLVYSPYLVNSAMALLFLGTSSS